MIHAYKEIDNGASVVPIPYLDIDWANRWHLVTEIGGGNSVSTVFLALDHIHSFLYETLVFGGTFDGEQIRYRTRAEAEAGHAKIVAMVTRGTQLKMKDLWKD